MIRLVVDGVVYGFQKFGGINTMFNAILPRLASAHDVSVNLLLPRRVLGEVPGPPVNRGYREIIPEETGISWKFDHWLCGPTSRVVNPLYRNIQLGLGPNTVYQSTYFTWPDRRVAHLATAHDMNHELLPELYRSDWGQWLRKQYREYLQRATRIVAVSAKTKSDIVRFYHIDPERIDVVHHGVDKSFFYPDRERSLSDMNISDGWPGRYLLYVGMRQGYKNFSTLLRALADIPSALCAGVVVAGKEWKTSELAMIRTLGIEDRIHLVDGPTQDQLRRLYSSSLAFVFPSIHEGLGLPLLEAMACGTVVLAADTEVFREVAGDAALYFTPDNSDELAALVAKVNEARERDLLLQRSALRIQNFSWDRCATQMYDCYRRTLVDWRNSR